VLHAHGCCKFGSQAGVSIRFYAVGHESWRCSHSAKCGLLRELAFLAAAHRVLRSPARGVRCLACFTLPGKVASAFCETATSKATAHATNTAAAIITAR